MPTVPEDLPELDELQPHDEPAGEGPAQEKTAQEQDSPEQSPQPIVADGVAEPEKFPRRPTRKIGEKRELEKAPLLLRKASMILLIGALFPFFSGLKLVAVPWGAWSLAKVLAVLAGWIFHQGYMATHGGKAAGFVDRLAKAHRMVPSILAAVIAIGAFVPAYMAGALGPIGGEVATLLLASATFSHIFGYEHGGKFNPLFPLMFLGPAIAGLLNVIGAVRGFSTNAGMSALVLVGSLVVAAGGVMAIYTMYVAMRQAKVEGDRKREELRAHRKAQREAQRAQRAEAQAAGAEAENKDGDS